MNRLFFPNFDFEHRLAGETRAGSPAAREAARRLAFCWLLVADDGDRVVLPESFEPGFLEAAAASGLPRVVPVAARGDDPNLRTLTHESARLAAGCFLVPWGWDESVRALAQALGGPFDAPSPAAVSRVNSRRFSFECETRWNVGLPGAAAIESLSQLEEALRSLAAGRASNARQEHEQPRWVLKAEFGMSARERLLGAGPLLSEATAGWTSRRLARDGVVFLEPWADRIDEAGIQLEVPLRGESRLVGVTKLLTDPSGGYVGSAFRRDDAFAAEFGDAVETGVRAAALAQQAGYYGPLGIDVMRHRADDGSIRLRPLQDVNARWTMGRIALGGMRWLRPGEQGEWRPAAIRCGHGPAADHARRHAELPESTRTLRTSPFEIGGNAVRAVSVLSMTEALSAGAPTEPRLRL